MQAHVLLFEVDLLTELTLKIPNYIIYNVNYLILRYMLGYTNDLQLHHKYHLMTLCIQACFLISWH